MLPYRKLERVLCCADEGDEAGKASLVEGSREQLQAVAPVHGIHLPERRWGEEKVLLAPKKLLALLEAL